MPNHARCIMRITGPLADLRTFKTYAQGPGPAWDGTLDPKKKINELDLNQFVPVPEDVLMARKNNMSDAYNSGGYEWCVNNWGTKWGCYDVTVKITKTELKYEFGTAWGPFGQNVMEAMSLRFPSLLFNLKYAESGMGFAGIMTAVGGEVSDAYADNGSALGKSDKEIKYLMSISG